MFVAGDDPEAKATVADLLRSFGWRSILDLGGIEAARGMEMYLPLWVSLMGPGHQHVQHQSSAAERSVARVASQAVPMDARRTTSSSSAAGTTGWSRPPTWPGPGRGCWCCERRDVVGGAAVSEHPFGPDFTVTSLSYVVSLLPPDMVRDLRLAEHGYHVYPQGPYFAPRRDGRTCSLPDDPAARHERDRASSAPRRRRRLRALGRLAGRARPAGRAAAGRDPAQAGLAAGPATCSARPRCCATLRKVDVRAAFDLTRLFTASIADLVEERFELRRDARRCSASPA